MYTIRVKKRNGKAIGNVASYCKIKLPLDHSYCFEIGFWYQVIFNDGGIKEWATIRFIGQPTNCYTWSIAMLPFQIKSCKTLPKYAAVEQVFQPRWLEIYYEKSQSSSVSVRKVAAFFKYKFTIVAMWSKIQNYFTKQSERIISLTSFH